MINELRKYGKVKENVNLKNYNTYKVNSTANYLVDINSEESLVNLIDYLNSNNVSHFIIGNGSNIILPSENFDGVIIKLSGLNKIIIDDDEVYCEAGVMLPKLCNEVVNNCLTGLEWASGIPGTVGGATIMNAGAYLSDFYTNLVSVKVLEKGSIKEYKKDEIKHSYRYTMFKDMNDIIILSVKLKFNKGNVDESLNIMKNRMERRIASQPLEYPSAGSTFRNPENNFAGKLIEDCGLKGKQIGGAMVSLKHANFIINYDNATSEDIKKLIDLTHSEVLNKFGVDLYLEQEIIEWR